MAAPGRAHSTIRTDVLVVGAGGAGYSAAMAAARQGAYVLVACKEVPGRGSATFVAGGIAASGPAPDSPEQHFLDTLRAGADLNDRRLVQLMVEGIGRRLEELETWGARFDRDERGGMARRGRGGHSYPRQCVIRGDSGGRGTVLALRRALRSTRVQVLGDLFISSLALAEGRVVGAVGLDLWTGELVSIRARATILATGGLGRLYPVTSMPRCATGDGYALAAGAGADLRDMEMVGFHPGGFYVAGPQRGLSCREPSHFATQGGRLVNGQGEPFAERYDRRGEFAPRDVLVKAEYAEIVAGRGTPNGGVYMDLRGLSDEARAALPRESPRLYRQARAAGVDLLGGDGLLEIGPTVHYMSGGVVADSEGRTTVPGLYACGEVVGGIHGANRLAGNSLAELLVLAPRVGEAAVRHARAELSAPVLAAGIQSERERIATLLRPGGPRSTEIEEELQAVMWRHVGVIRSGEGLATAESELTRLRQVGRAMSVSGAAGPFNHGLLHALEVLNLLESGELVAASARHRLDSRGTHYREDHPTRDDARWQVGVVCRREGEQVRVWTEPVPAPS